MPGPNEKEDEPTSSPPPSPPSSPAPPTDRYFVGNSEVSEDYHRYSSSWGEEK